MSFFSKLFAQKTGAELAADGKRRLAEGNLGAAKIAFENALASLGPLESGARVDIEAQLLITRDRIAEGRLAQAELHQVNGDEQLALEEVDGAIELAASDAVRAKAIAFRKRFEENPAVERASGGEVAVSAEEKLAALAGSWEADQSDEYERYGAPFEDVLLALVEAAEAATLAESPDAAAAEAAQHAAFDAPLADLEGIASTAGEGAVFIHFELGRARIAAGRAESGAEALREFLKRLPEGSGGESRLLAHLELARLADARGSADEAMGELERAIETMPEDPRPFLALGQYLRRTGHAAEAVDVLHSALAVMGEGQPDWRVLEELGLAEKARGRSAQAVDFLEQVIDTFTSKRIFDVPRESSLALAELYEAAGRPERAADIFRLLAEGSHRAAHVRYYREAARLLDKADLPEEAARLRRKALAVAEARGDDAARDELSRELAVAS